MVGQGKRPLKVFLCHASGDKPAVRQLYKRLVTEGLDAWLDQEKLLPGQDWRMEIPRAVREADVVVICLSNRSITKEGYIQKEIKFALDIADEKPEGTIFLIPARLEDCPVPERLNRWQWVDLFDENGFIRLLRSLKIRADKTGAVIEPIPYDDKELEKRLEKLYTEGLAAFWVEDWDKACHRFQTILSEQPNHQGAIEKLEEAERQRNFAKLYSKAVEAQKNQEWQLAINTLEELLKKASTYKDTEAMLKTARKEQQLKVLYAEAKTLHTAQKWEAVLKVFDQISSIEPNYADPEGLLASAQKEEAELKRLAKLNELYSSAIHKMDAGQWYEARTLLEQVHKSETGFLETERLLRKVEDEISRQEEQQKRQDQINTLYEQANGLLRSKKWRKAQEKIEQIRTLDGQFDDPEKIAEQAQKELEREEQEAERQNELAAMYTEAVRFVREENYQEALEKLQEVKNIDPKYPDRQMVQWTASRSLKSLANPVSEKRKVTLPKSLWLGLGGIVAIAIIYAISTFGDGNRSSLLGTAMAPTAIVRVDVAPASNAVLKEERIVFSSTRDGLSDQIFLMDPDGGNVEQITFDPGYIRRYPSISPDGDQIAFSSGDWGSMNIYLINPDGSELTTLTDLSGDEMFPKWSPDGKTIVFSTTLNGNAEIYSISLDGTNLTRLTNIESEDRAPYWSPDGTKIVFQSDRDGDFDIYTMNPDGSVVTRLTENPSADMTPSWSPDGEKIAFRSSRDGNDEIYIMKKDGSEPINITNNSGNDYGPNWSPDGKNIVFFSDSDGVNNVYSIDIASKVIKNLTNNPAGDGGPYWGFVVSDTKTTKFLTPTTGIYADPTLIDDFNNPKYDGNYNHSLWDLAMFHIDAELAEDSIKQMDGEMILSISGNDTSLGLMNNSRFSLASPNFCETQIRLDENSGDGWAYLKVGVYDEIGYFAQVGCSLSHDNSGNQVFGCHSGKHVDKDYVDIFNTISLKVDPTEWQTVRIEMYPDDLTFKLYINENLFFSKSNMADFASAKFSCSIEVSDEFKTDSTVIGYFDNFRMGTIADDPTVYDDFDNASYNGSYDHSLWNFVGNSKDFFIGQSDGNLSININDKADIGLYTIKGLRITEPTFFEARTYLDPKTTNKGCHLFMELSNDQGYSNCGIFRTGDNAQQIKCWSEYYGKMLEADLDLNGILPDWHILRFEVEPETMTIIYVIDGKALNSINLKQAFPSNFRLLKQVQFNVGIAMNNYGPADEPVGYVDYVRTGAIADDPNR